jgi:hypothetical protein
MFVVDLDVDEYVEIEPFTVEAEKTKFDGEMISENDIEVTLNSLTYFLNSSVILLRTSNNKIFFKDGACDREFIDKDHAAIDLTIKEAASCTFQPKIEAPIPGIAKIVALTWQASTSALTTEFMSDTLLFSDGFLFLLSLISGAAI